MSQTVKFVQESAFGTTPATPAWRALRVTQSSLGASPQTVRSAELVASRHRLDLIRTAFEVGGEIPTELSYGNLDYLIPGVLWATGWSLTSEKDNAGTADSAITDAVAATDTFVTTAVSPAWAEGMIVVASGFTNAGNNGTFVAQATSSATALVVPASPGLTDEAAPPGTARLKMVGFRCAAGDAALDASAKTITISAASGDLTTLGLAAGRWIKMSGWTTAANNVYVRVLTVTATVLTWDIAKGMPVTEAAAAQTVSLWIGDHIEDAAVANSFSFEHGWPDLTTPEFHYFTGNRVERLALAIPRPNIITAAVSFQGKGASIVTSRFAGSTDIAAPTNDVMNSADHVAMLLEDGSNLVGAAGALLSMQIAFNNNLQRLPQVGSVESARIDSNDLGIECQAELYYDSSAIVDKIRAGTASSYALAIEDPDGTKAYVIDLPRIKYGGGDPLIPAKGQPSVIQPTFEGLRHAALGYAVSWQRFEEIA
jgi:hypothetical protein